MRSRSYLVLALLVLWPDLPRAAAQGNVVVNGGFDSNASGWTTNIYSGYYDLKGNPGACFTLTSLTTNLAMISQTINGLVPGVRYAISASYSVEGGNLGSTPSLGVAINGSFVFQVAPPDYAWRSFVFAWPATSSSATLGLAAHINGTSNSYRVDNIVMQPTPSVTVRIAGTNSVVSWPTNVLGFSLQSTTNLNPASWVSVSNAATIDGTNYSVAVGAARQAQFFRLKR